MGCQRIAKPNLSSPPKFSFQTDLALETKITIGAKIITLHNFIFQINSSNYVICFLHRRIGFELFPRLCNFLCCCKAYHVDMRLYLIHQLSNLFLHYRIGFELNIS